MNMYYIFYCKRFKYNGYGSNITVYNGSNTTVYTVYNGSNTQYTTVYNGSNTTVYNGSNTTVYNCIVYNGSNTTVQINIKLKYFF
jgi:hypothetical protein